MAEDRGSPPSCGCPPTWPAADGDFTPDGKHHPSCPRRDVDPRSEADAQIARALQIVVDASAIHADNDAPNGRPRMERRDYEPAELDTLFFALSMAVVQLKKVPGGRKAGDRGLRTLREELARRGAKVDAAFDLEPEAVKIVRRAFGDGVDLGKGTTGRALVGLVTLELQNTEALREQLLALAATIRQP